MEKFGYGLSTENKIYETDIRHLDEEVCDPVAEATAPHEIHDNLWAAEESRLEGRRARSDDGVCAKRTSS